MTSPLDEKTECDLCAGKAPVGDAVVCDGCGRAYLSATALPDELEVVAWDRLRELIGEYFDLGYAEGVVQRDTDTMAGDAQRTLSEIEAIISQAHSTIAAMRDRTRIERALDWQEGFAHAEGVYRDTVKDAEAHADTAEAEVKRLTEDNEALRAERDAAFAMSKCECGPEEACRNLAIDKARIKALKEALRPFAALANAIDADDPEMPDRHIVAARAIDLRGNAVRVTLGHLRTARAILTQENADGQ